MEVEIIKQEKSEVELKIDNTTVAEILRVYLDEGGIDFVAWKREHPSKPAVMRVESRSLKKDVSGAVSAIKKDLDAILKSVKK